MSILNRTKKFTAMTLLGGVLFISSLSLVASALSVLTVTYEISGGLTCGIKNTDGSDMDDLTLAPSAVSYSSDAQTVAVEFVYEEVVGKEAGYFVAANTSGTASVWTLSLAPTSGAQDAVWDGPGSITMDFNDADTGLDGADTDTVGGQLSVLKIGETANIDALVGTTDGVSFVGGAFSGETGSVTLMSGTDQTSAPGVWGLTDVKFQQVIPGSQAGGTYTMDFTLSII